MLDDSRPADSVGLGDMCILKGFWKILKCAIKIRMGCSLVPPEVAGCIELVAVGAHNLLSLAFSVGQTLTSHSSLVGCVR